MDLSQIIDLHTDTESAIRKGYAKDPKSGSDTTLIDSIGEVIKELSSIDMESASRVEESLVGVMYATLQIRRWCRYRKSDNSSSNPVYLYQYTSASTFDNVFSKYTKEDSPNDNSEPRFWLAPTDYLNDPEEGKYFYKKLRNKVQIKNEPIQSFLNNFFEYVDSDRSFIGLKASTPVVFSASFCSAEDNLNLWRFYGDKGRGVSFGISENNFDHSSEEALVHLSLDEIQETDTHDPLYRIRYGEELANYAIKLLLPSLKLLSHSTQKISDKTELDSIKTILFTLLQTVAFLFKSESYADECEFRIMRISTLSEENDDLEYMGNKVFLTSKTPFISKKADKESNSTTVEEPTIITVGPNHIIEGHKRSNLESSRVDISFKINKAINSFESLTDVKPKVSPIIKISNKKFRSGDG